MQKRNSSEYGIENNRQYRIGIQFKKVKMCRKYRKVPEYGGNDLYTMNIIVQEMFGENA